jgi:hypothetical protein
LLNNIQILKKYLVLFGLLTCSCGRVFFVILLFRHLTLKTYFGSYRHVGFVSPLILYYMPVFNVNPL